MHIITENLLNEGAARIPAGTHLDLPDEEAENLVGARYARRPTDDELLEFLIAKKGSSKKKKPKDPPPGGGDDDDTGE